MTMEERSYRIAIAMCRGLEPSTAYALVHGLGSAQAVWESDMAEWMTVCRIHPSTAESLRRWRARFNPLEAEPLLLHRGIHCLVEGGELYPPVLYELHQPPLVLFAKGTLHSFQNTVSVVGTRRPTSYGLEATKWVAEALSQSGCHIVSGLAEGIDTAAHQSAVQVPGCTTAVLACGVDVCYPKQNQRLYEQIIVSGGLIVSEYAPGEMVAKYRFPQRNRLIAALSSTLIIVQAGEKSGALRTADAALELGRDVYVVPGPITSQLYRGSNRLLQQGAQVLLDPFDFLANIGITGQPERGAEVPSRWRAIYDNLVTPQTPQSLALQIDSPVSHVYAGLLELELAGLIERQPGGAYGRCLQKKTVW